MFLVTKTYGHDLGLSACFRQPQAQSHCRFLHGYPLSFKFTFSAEVLDKNNWVIDFGGLKPVKKFLEDNFDHKLIIAEDDPQFDDLVKLAELRLASINILPAVGCEAFAQFVFKEISNWMMIAGHYPRVNLVEVEVREHGGNSAIYRS